MSKRAIIFLCLIIFIQYSYAQIAHDASSTNSCFSCASGSHTHVTTGSNMILIASFALMNGKTISSATYNGTTLTQKTVVDGSLEAELWYLISPATGSQTFAFVTTPNTAYTLAVNSWTAVDQTTPFGTVVTGTGSAVTSGSIVVSSATNEVVIDLIVTYVDCTVGSGQTERASKSDFYSAHTSSEAGAASVTMSWTFSSDDYSMIGVPLKPYISGPLPIELSKFEVKLINEQVFIFWTTLSETNNDFFTVERSIDGINFEIVQIVPGAGNSASELSYEVIDDHPHKGTSYYRLKQTDFDGGFEYSDLTAINTLRVNTPDTLKVGRITPNPVDDNNFTVQIIYAPTNELTVTIYNLMGEIFYSKMYNIPNGLKQLGVGIDIELSDGSYLVVFESGDELVSKRLVVSRR